MPHKNTSVAKKVSKKGNKKAPATRLESSGYEFFVSSNSNGDQ